MNSENNPNARTSGETSRTAPPRPEHPDKVTEADYITRQQDEARAAISAVIADMKRALADGADVREWTRRYPWIMAGTAVVAGFAAAALMAPSKKEPFEEFWNSIKDKVTPPPVGTTPSGVVPPVVPVEKPGMMTTMVREALKSLGPILGGLITSTMVGQHPPEGDGHPSNGNYPPGADRPVNSPDVAG